MIMRKKYLLLKYLSICLISISTLCFAIQFLLEDDLVTVESVHTDSKYDVGKINRPKKSEFDKFVEKNLLNYVDYTPFNMSKPIFVDSDDERIFKLDYQNIKTVGVRLSYEMRGKVVVLRPGYFSNNLKCSISTNIREWKGRPSSPIVHTYNALVPLVTGSGCSMTNFLTEILPKLYQIKNWIKFEEVLFLIHGTCDPLVKGILKKFEINPKRLISFKGGAIHVERQINTCIAPTMHPVIFKDTRKILDIQETIINGNDVILLLPSDTQLLKNENSVRKFLNDRFNRNFKEMEEIYSLEILKNSLKDAKIIIGVHHSILTNIFFAPKGCVIIEIVATKSDGTVRPTNIDPRLIWHLAISMGHTYYRIIESPTSIIGNVHLTISKLAKALDMIENQVKI